MSDPTALPETSAPPTDVMAHPVNLAAPEIEASRLLHEIGTPEALAAIDELIEAGKRRCAAFRRAAEILLAAVPTPPTEH